MTRNPWLVSRRPLLAAAWLACAAPVFAQATAPLPAGFEDWDTFIQQQLVRWKVPGISIAIVKDGQVVLSRGYGLRDTERQLPMTDLSVQPIASVTKSFTVAALATQVRDGKLEWDKPVRDYLPDFRLHSDYATQTVTVRDLVTHRTGLPRHDFAWYGSTLTREQLFQRLRHFELSAEPRARFQYNNLMYMTAGYLGGKVAGSEWETLVASKVLQPLGMVNTSFSVADLKKAADHATGYTLDNNEVPRPRPFQELVAMGPTGSLNSNARDMSQYLLMLAGGGSFKGQVLIPTSDMRAMTTGQMTLADSRLWPERSSPQYGMGWFIENYRGATLVNHGGNLEGASTALGFVPGRNMGVYATVNVSGSFMRDVVLYAAIDRLLGLPPVDWSARFHDIYSKNRDARKVAREQQLAPGRPGTRPSFALDDYAGEYEHPGYGRISIGLQALSGGSLTLGYNGFKAPLPHRHVDVFMTPRYELSELSETRVQFLSGFDGEVEALRVEIEPAVKPVEFKRLPDARFADRNFLAPLAGAYRVGIREFNVTLRPDGVLTLAGRVGAAQELLGKRGTRFEVKNQPGVTLEFVPDDKGLYTRLVITRSGTAEVAQRVAAP